ncbi:MAG: outer membrane protein assembly factor BamD [Alphaproteobacteria bacterium]|nr:outer membrane protein assembly factor BamD [Alphaproteobacteria bacterium]
MQSCRRYAVVFGLSAALLAGCSSDEKPVYQEKPVTSLYNAGLDDMAQGNYKDAAKQFEEVERQHPFSIWAPRAQIMGAYAHFEADEYDDAIINIDRFIQLHPNHEDAPYAYYLKALAYYEQIVDVQRDQAITAKALQALNDVYRRFPDSVYARDAQLKRDLAFDHLAGKDMSIGRFYLRSGEPLAAINRFRSVLRDYQTTSHVPEALHRLVEAYTSLGLHEEAEKTAAVLGYNFPGSQWYSDSYFLLTGKRVRVKAEYDDRGFLDRTWDYLVVPSHTIGVVDLDAEPERKQDLTTPLESTGPTFATLGGGDAQAEQDDTAKAAAAGAADAANAAGVAGAAGAAGVAGAAGAAADAALPTPGTQPAQPAQAAETLASPAVHQKVQSQLDAANGHVQTAKTAAAAWQKAADGATNDQERERAANNAEIASKAGDYWQARADLLDLALNEPDNADSKRQLERQLAETALTYWRTVERLGETQTERDLAAKNANDAEQALTYWNDQGRGWLGRLFGGSS